MLLLIDKLVDSIVYIQLMGEIEHFIYEQRLHDDHIIILSSLKFM